MRRDLAKMLVSVLAWALLALIARAAPDVKSFDCTNAPTICDNACYYDFEEGGNDLWINKGFNYNLETGPSKPNRDKRRSTIGCKSGRCANGLSCDEYPFASTYQGGLGVIPGPYYHNQDGTTVCVPLSEQQSQGGQIKGWVTGKPDGYNFVPFMHNVPANSNCDPNKPKVEPATHQHVTTPQRRRELLRQGKRAPVERHAYQTESGVITYGLHLTELLPLNTTIWISDEGHPLGGRQERIVRQFPGQRGIPSAGAAHE